MIHVKIDKTILDEALKTHLPKLVRRAAAYALGRAATSGTAAAKKEIQDVYTVAPAKTNKYVIKGNVDRERLTVTITGRKAGYEGRKLPLIDFETKVQSVTRKGRTKTSARVTKKWKPRKGVPGTQVITKVRKTGTAEPFRHAFLAKMKSGHVGVFELKQPQEKSDKTGRYKIRQLTGPDINEMFSRPRVQEKVKEKAIEQFKKDFAHYLTGGYGNEK